MHILDWAIVASLLVFITSVVMQSRRHVKSVADFLVAGRSVGRNMMALAEGSVWIGAVNIIAMFEMYYNGGFSSIWWNLLFETTWIFMAVSGWLLYRYRQTRALTVAQFLNMRYSKNVRIVAAILAWTAGVINFGIFPAVGSRFFIYFCGLPDHFTVFGITISTFLFIMVSLITVSLFYVFVGGQVTVVVANFYQGAFTNIAGIIIVTVLFTTHFNWHHIVEALQTAPVEASRIDPFHSSGVKDFNVWYFLIAVFGAWYCQLSFLGSQACNASATTAHEYKMSRVLNHWRWMALCLFFMVLVLVSYTCLHHPAYVDESSKISAVLDRISPDPDNAIRLQQTVTVALTRILPSGLKGLMAAIMLAAVISTYDTFLHTWGTVFVQDFVIPFRKKPLTTKQQMKFLRLSIFGVGVFILLFSWLYPQRQSILMYFALINNIWLGGSGAIMIGGLYWKRGTTSAAMTSLILGAIMSVTGIICVQSWPVKYGTEFPVNGQWIFFSTIIVTSIVYITVSLMSSKKETFNLDKLLHRGKYAIDEDQTHVSEKTKFYQKIFGITKEFTLFDRITTYLIVGWSTLLLMIFLAGTTYGLIIPISEDVWAKFWFWYMVQLFVMFVVSTVWLTLGGLRDVRKMNRVLLSRKRDYSDDGRVSHGEATENESSG
jgi:solute:Na+ symporter, SSS family